jgi:hypothetical protein
VSITQYAQAQASGALGGEDDSRRLARYGVYLKFDAGQHDVGRIPPGGWTVVANYGRTFIRKGASYLFPGPVTIAVDPPTKAAAALAVAQRMETELQRIAVANALPVADLTTAIDAGILGDGAFKVTWDKDRADVRIVPVDVQALRVVTAPDNPLEAIAVRHVYTMPSASILARWGVVGTAGEESVCEEWTADRLTFTVGATIVEELGNPYGFIPYVIFPNMPRPHSFWGDSDLDGGVMEVNRVIDRRLTVVGNILELSGNPITVLENVTGSEGISVSPGALWELPAESRAYLLDLLSGGAVAQHLAVIEGLYRVLHDVSENPRSSFGDAGSTVSGLALEFVLQPLIQKVNRKRLVWSGVYDRRARMALTLLQRFGGLSLGRYKLSDFTMRPTWPPMLPADRHELVGDELALVKGGLHSVKTAMNALGVLDAEAESQQIEQEGVTDGVHTAATAGPDTAANAGHIGQQPAMDGQPAE